MPRRQPRPMPPCRCLWFAVLLPACTAVVTPPAGVRDGVTVFVLGEALHCGLVLPAAEPPGYVEFGFGDFDWYALGDDGVANVAATVLWPTPGTLVRRPWPVRQDASLAQLAWFCELQPVVVERAAAAQLCAELERQFAGAAAAPFGHVGSTMQFVPCAQGYWLLHNCHDVVAGWLRRLGGSVSWVPICTGLRLRSP